MAEIKTKKILVLCLVVIVVLLTIANYYPIRVGWRMSVLDLKWSGKLPNLTWYEVLTGLMPPKNHLREIVSGRVKIKRVEPNGSCPALCDTKMGAFWARYEEHLMLEWVMKEQLEDKFYDHEFARVKKGDVVLDIGAHIGTFTRFALNKGAQLIVAFEPDPSNIVCFKQNFEKEIREQRVILIEAAAWNSPGTLNFKIDSQNPIMSMVKEDGEFVVTAVTIDETIRNLGLNQVDFIKMDIEGAERYAIAGAHGTISLFGPRMALCIYHLEDDPKVISQLVLEFNSNYRVVQKKSYNQKLAMAYFF